MLRILLLGIILSKTNSQRMGPYELRVESLKPCTVPDKKPYDVPFNVERFEEGGRTYLRWNLTMPRRNVPFKVHFMISMTENNVSKKVYENDGIACQHFVPRAILTLSNFNLDESTGCGINKGFYHSAKLDADYLSHLMSKVMPYGEYMMRQEWYVPRGVVTCHEFVCRAVPLKKDKTK